MTIQYVIMEAVIRFQSLPLQTDMVNNRCHDITDGDDTEELWVPRDFSQ